MRDLLQPANVWADFTADSKKQVLTDLAARAAQHLGIGEHDIFNVLWEREKLGTTGVGAGIAIPHGRIEGLTAVTGFFARLATPLSFEAIDHRPVDLVFLLLAPQDAGADHLHALATVSRQLRDPRLCEAVRTAKDAATIYNLMTTPPTVQAA
jgi:PTS system nitrogen regulatory IIA component